MVTSLAIYCELEQKRYEYLTPVEQKIIRLGAAALAKPIGTIIACQSAMDEHKRLKQTDDYSKMEVMLEGFLSQLEIAIAQLPEDNNKSRS